MRGRKRHRKKAIKRGIFSRPFSMKDFLGGKEELEKFRSAFNAVLESEMRRGDIIHEFVESFIGEVGDETKPIWRVRE